MYQFDPFLLDWKMLSNETETAPACRRDFSFTAANGAAYVFGGAFESGTKKAGKKSSIFICIAVLCS
jgi:hypothetical protein